MQSVVEQTIVVHRQSVGEVDRLLLQSSPNVEGSLLIRRIYYVQCAMLVNTLFKYDYVACVF